MILNIPMPAPRLSFMRSSSLLSHHALPYEATVAIRCDLFRGIFRAPASRIVFGELS